MLSVVMLSVIVLNVIMVSVMSEFVTASRLHPSLKLVTNALAYYSRKKV